MSPGKETLEGRQRRKEGVKEAEEQEERGVEAEVLTGKRMCRGASIKESEDGSLNKVRRAEEEQPRHCVRRGSRHTV